MKITHEQLKQHQRTLDEIADLCADAGWTDIDTHAICTLESSYQLRAAYTGPAALDNQTK